MERDLIKATTMVNIQWFHRARCQFFTFPIPLTRIFLPSCTQIASLLLFRFIIYILWSWRPWDCEWSMHHDARKRLQAVRALWEPRKWSKKSGIRIAWDGTRGTNEWIDGHGHYVVTRVLKWSTLNILIVLYPASWSHLCFHETVSYSRHAFSIITWEDHLGIPSSWLIRTIKRIVNYRIYLCSPLSLSLSFESSIL